MAEDVKSEDDIKQMEEAIAKARDSLVSKSTEDDIAKAKTEARAEALKEVETQKALDEKDKELADLKAKQAASEVKAAEELTAMKEKINDFVGSKAQVNVNDPFQRTNNNNETDGKIPIKDLSDEQIDNLEEQAARDFFGDSYHIVEKLRRELS